MSVNVVAVIVTYQPDLALLREIPAVAPQVSRVLVVDNGSTGNLICSAGSHEKVEVISLHTNLGVATAHNVGIRRASKEGASHVLLLDQDSLPQPDMVEKLLAAERDLTGRGE